MKKSIKCGLASGFGFIGIIGAIILFRVGMDIILGHHDLLLYTSNTYVISIGIGFVASFLGGYLFPILLSNSISCFRGEYPGVPHKYVEEICRGKLLQKYCLNISWISFALSFIYDIDSYPLLVYFLTSCSFVSLFNYFKYRNRYKGL